MALDVEALIVAHQAGVWRYLRFLGCDRAQADDITQETFLQVLRRGFEERGERETAAWLRTVARNCFLMNVRRTRHVQSVEDLDLADKWVNKYGDITFFICRMLPVVRTFISFPAGVLKAHFWMFVASTFIGSLIWCYFLTWVGIEFGKNMEVFVDLWHKFDVAIVVVGLALFGIYLKHHLKHD